ncbi:MAG: ECF transporter S component [Candidatus Methanomethyliaceae archaeon]|nr:ECF transporter S component [Candidatus Methanomethyliaceae archaeon]MDW7970301.1 ECF transporter S component [Nitrososphaerota archaeon]
MSERFLKAKMISEIAIFSAISGIGAMMPIPSPVGSIALDSFPGYFMALWRGIVGGASVCAIGHLISAIRAGFPLGSIHIAVALLMAFVGFVTAIVNKKFGTLLGLSSGVIINTAGVVLAVPALGWGIIPILLPILFVASVVNATIAGIIYKSIKR